MTPRKKRSGLTVSQDELATDFSNEVKLLQPRTAKIARDVKRRQIDDNFLSEFIFIDKTFLKLFEFSVSDTTDSEPQHILRVLI